MAFTNDISVRAENDLLRAERDAATAREKLTRAEAEINDLRAFLRKLEHYAAPVDETGHEQRPTRRRRGSGGKAKQLADFCIAEIRKAEDRVPIADLFAAAIAAGMDIGGKDEKSNLAGYLSRDKRINFAHGQGWGMVETEGTATEPDSNVAVPSHDTGGNDERPTLVLPVRSSVFD